MKFRSTGIEACDHSECFLFSYDLHRIHNTRERPPRILINPSVKVAYQRHWFRWQNTVLRVPMIKWWLGEYFVRRAAWWETDVLLTLCLQNTGLADTRSRLSISYGNTEDVGEIIAHGRG